MFEVVEEATFPFNNKKKKKKENIALTEFCRLQYSSLYVSRINDKKVSFVVNASLAGCLV